MSSRHTGQGSGRKKADQTQQTPGPSGSSRASKGRRRQPSPKKRPNPPRPSTSKPPSTPIFQASSGAQTSMSSSPFTRSSLKRPAGSTGSTEQSYKKTRRETQADWEAELNVVKQSIVTALGVIGQYKHFTAEEQRVVDDVIGVWELFLSVAGIYRELRTIRLRPKLPPSARFDLPRSGLAKQANALFENYAKLWNMILAGGVSPSEFAKPSEWAKSQAKSPILCLRPPTAIGLPLHTLYDGFRKFKLNISRTDFEITREARLAAAALCEWMGASFLSEVDRSNAIDTALEPLFPKWTHQQKLELDAGQTFGIVDRVILLKDNFISILGEDKLECVSTASDGYMQVTRDFDLYVHYVRSRLDSKCAAAYLAAGAPAFLMVVQGPSILICGGFNDGRMTIVEPLMDPILMLRDYTGDRPKRLARVLTALKAGHREVVALINRPEPQPPTVPFPPCTPRLYQECELFDTGEVADLRFKGPLAEDHLGAVNRLIFLATLHRRSTSVPTEDVIVKIVPNYGVEVHQYLATEKWAPSLYAKSRLEGAPTAYIIECLPSQWITLYSLEADMPKVFDEHSQKIYNKLKKVLKLLKVKGFVHGDFRSNNIMIDIATLQNEGTAEIKIVDFDWSGKANTTWYPELRNTEIISWPGEPGGPIEQEDDAKLLESWWHVSLRDVRKRVSTLPH